MRNHVFISFSVVSSPAGSSRNRTEGLFEGHSASAVAFPFGLHLGMDRSRKTFHEGRCRKVLVRRAARRRTFGHVLDFRSQRAKGTMAREQERKLGAAVSNRPCVHE